MFDDYNNRSTMLNTDLTNSTQKATYYTYNRANQLVREETTLNGTTDTDYTYRYDAGGNMLAKEKNLADGTLQSVMSNTFDKFNRVASTTVRNDSGNNVTTSFSYDSNDHRINKTTSGTTTNQIWNGDNIICDDVGGTIKTYIQGNDTEGMLTANGFYTNIYNGRGDVVESHQLGGSTIEDYQYDAFGVNKSTATYTVSNPYRYSGEYTDSETGLYLLSSRYYNPEIGRFISEDDPSYTDSNNPLSANLYTYCLNNPVMYVDPTGHAAQKTYSGIVGFGIQICLVGNIGCFQGYFGVEALWFAFTGNNNFGNGIIPWCYAFGGFSGGYTFDISKLLSPKLLNNPKNVLQGFGINLSLSLSVTVFLIQANKMKDPWDYTRSFNFAAFTVWGVTGSKAWGSNISTYGVGVTWQIGISKWTCSFGQKLFGGVSGSSYYWMLPLNRNAQALYSEAQKAGR